MTSPDTIILLIVDYHAAIGGGGKSPVPPLRTPLTVSVQGENDADGC